MRSSGSGRYAVHCIIYVRLRVHGMLGEARLLFSFDFLFLQVAYQFFVVLDVFFD